MGFLSVTTFSLNLYAAPPHQFFSVAGRVLLIGPKNRPLQILPAIKKMYPVSVMPPIYLNNGSGSDTVVYGQGALTCVASAGSTEMPGGTVWARERFRRGSTDEPSELGTAIGPTTVTAGQNITITSTASAPDDIAYTDSGITHREFFVAYEEAPDVYFFWQETPYTAAGNSTVAAGMSFTTLSARKQAPVSGEVGIFPAVSTGTYAFGTFLGAGMVSRTPATASITLTLNSRVATMPGITVDNGFFASDVYRAIVYVGTTGTISGRMYTKGETLAFIEYPYAATRATLKFAQGVDVRVWPYATVTFSNTEGSAPQFALVSRSRTDLFRSSVYAGEIGGGISNGLFMWSPFNTLRDQQNFATAGKCTFLGRAAGYVIAGYERGMSLLSTEFSTDMPPQATFMSLSDDLGSFNPQAMWSDNDRRMYFFAQGRFLRLDGARLTDLGQQGGVASYFRKFVGTAAGSPQLGRVSFNSERNAALIVGLTRVGDADPYMYALYVSFDRTESMVLCPMRFPNTIRTACAAEREVVGVQFNQWFLGGLNGRVYTFANPGQEKDTYYNAAGTLVSDASVTLKLKTGIMLVDWKATTERFGMVFKSGASAFGMTVTTDVFATADLSAYTRSLPKTLSKGQLDRELTANYRDCGRAFQFTFTGNNAGVLARLYRLSVFLKQEKPKI